MRKQFGAKASKSNIDKYQKSKNWDGKKFLNLETTTMDISFQNLPKLLYDQFCKRKGREPKRPIPVQVFDKEAFLAPSGKTKFIWYGHSVLLLRMNNKTLLIDPMLGSNAAPIAPFKVKRFSENTLDLINDFPEIDLLLVSHDHYDHLDLDSILRLQGKVKKYVVALGVGRHLVKWGIPENDILESDWWDDFLFEGIRITFTPSRHFSGRGISDRAKSLWGGFVFKTDKENLWFSGDGGYGTHFKEIGEKLGPFDFAWMENGQYNKLWHQIHMYPEEAIQAAIEGKANEVMPVHWAGFALALHSWTDPVERFVAEAEKQNLPYRIPQIGELISLEKVHEQKIWWNE